MLDIMEFFPFFLNASLLKAGTAVSVQSNTGDITAIAFQQIYFGD